MQELKQLVRTLSKSEIRFISHYYKNDTDKKRLKLFKLLMNDVVKTDEQAAIKLYGKKGSAYSHLKGRLRKDLLNLLLFQGGEKQTTSERKIVEINVLRNILLSKILYNRNAIVMANKMLLPTIDDAEEYELVAEKIIAADLLSTNLGFREGIKEFERVSSRIDKDFDLLKNLYLAKKIRYNITLPNTFKTNDEGEYARLAKISTEKLRDLFKESGSPNVGYFYYLTAISYYSIERNFEEVYDYSMKMVEIVRNNSALKSNVSILNANLQLYGALVYLGRYEEALGNAVLAKDFAVPKGVNEITTIGYIFLAQFRLDDNEALETTIKSAFKHPKLRSSKFIESKWIFYQAAFHFKMGSFQDCLSELQKESELLKDRSGWLFGHKLLEILSYAEQGEFDMIDFRIEALRKLLQRQKHKNIRRIKTVFEILNTLVKTGYNFKQTLEKDKEKFLVLEQGEEDYFWDPLGYEIIRFDKWFRSKA